MLLKRFDNKDQLQKESGRKIVNRQIWKNLSKIKRTTLICNDHINQSDFLQDKYHMSRSGFDKMLRKWKQALCNY